MSVRKEGVSDEAWEKVCDEIGLKIVGYRRAGLKKTSEELLKEFEEYEKYCKSREAYEYHVKWTFWLTRSDRRLDNYYYFVWCEELREAGKSYSEISEETGLSTGRIHRLLAGKGVCRWTIKDIAEWCGLSESAVRRALKEKPKQDREEEWPQISFREYRAFRKSANQ